MSTTAEAEVYMAMWKGLVVPHLFSVLIGALASGAVLSQVIQFFSKRESRKCTPRTLDTILVALMALSTALLLGVEWWGLYSTLITNHLTPSYPQLFHVPNFLIPPLAGLGLTASQVWFAERAWRVTERSWLFALASFLALGVSFAASLSLCINGITRGAEPDEWDSLRRQILTWLFSGAAADLISTFVLVWQARRFALQRRGTASSEGGRGAVLKIVKLAFATGSLTSATALAGGAVYITTHAYSNDFLPFVDALPRLSILSCLITIHSRDAWRLSRGSSSLPTTIRLPELAYQTSRSASGSGSGSGSGPDDKKPRPPKDGSLAGLYAGSAVESSKCPGTSHRRTPDEMSIHRLRNWKLPSASSPKSTPTKAREHTRSASDGGLAGHTSELSIGSGAELDRALRNYGREDKSRKGWERPRLEVVERREGVVVLDFSRAVKGFSPVMTQEAQGFKKHERTLSGITVEVEQSVVRD